MSRYFNRAALWALFGAAAATACCVALYLHFPSVVEWVRSESRLNHVLIDFGILAALLLAYLLAASFGGSKVRKKGPGSNLGNFLFGFAYTGVSFAVFRDWRAASLEAFGEPVWVVIRIAVLAGGFCLFLLSQWFRLDD